MLLRFNQHSFGPSSITLVVIINIWYIWYGLRIILHTVFYTSSVDSNVSSCSENITADDPRTCNTALKCVIISDRQGCGKYSGAIQEPEVCVFNSPRSRWNNISFGLCGIPTGAWCRRRKDGGTTKDGFVPQSGCVWFFGRLREGYYKVMRRGHVMWMKCRSIFGILGIEGKRPDETKLRWESSRKSIHPAAVFNV